MLSRIEREGSDIIGKDRVAYKATRSMSVKANHEKKRQMMGVPESLKTLLTDLVVGSAVHEYDDEQHKVTGYAARLGVMDLQCGLLAYL